VKELKIEWRHYDKEGATCMRCSNTGKTLNEVVKLLAVEFKDQGIQVSFTETLLQEKEIALSNLILFNGVPLEEILEDAGALENACPSCTCLTGKETSCRTVEHEGVTYEEIPAELIRKAALKAILAG
jgi:hypothetical protein